MLLLQKKLKIMKDELFDIPECELVLSRKTFSENPTGFKAFLYSAISLFVAIIFAVFCHFLANGWIYHIDLFVIGRMEDNSSESVLRVPGIILISTKALMLAMPAMSMLFSIISMGIIIKEKTNNRSTGLFAFAFAFSFFATILTIVKFKMQIDLTEYFWWSNQ